MPQLKVSLGIGFANARQEDVIEIDDNEWNECETEQAQQNLIEEYSQDWAWKYIDIGAVLVEEN